MSYSGQTTHYGIPLPTSSDLVNLLDWNQSSEDIDTALYGAAQAAADAGTEIVGIKATLVQLANADVQFQSDLNAIDGRVTSLEQTSGNIEEDVKDIADMITAKEVPTAQSDQRILVDEWFRYNGVLYVCTVQIEIGDTIVPNVNCRATNIESEMAAGGGGAEIDDTTTSASKVWSSQKTSAEILTAHTGDVRFSNGKLQQYNGTQWVDVQIGGAMFLNYANAQSVSMTTGTSITASADGVVFITHHGAVGANYTLEIDGNTVYTSSGNVAAFITPLFPVKSGQVITHGGALNNASLDLVYVPYAN